MTWHILQDLGMRPARRRFRKMARHLWCKCDCGATKVMTASQLASLRCNEVKHCSECRPRRRAA